MNEVPTDTPDLRLDCHTCVAANTTACSDCVVGHLLANDDGPIPLVSTGPPAPIPVVAPAHPSMRSGNHPSRSGTAGGADRRADQSVDRAVALLVRAGLVDDPPAWVARTEFESAAESRATSPATLG